LGAAQVDLAGRDVGVQTVFARAALFEGAKEPSFGNVEGRGFDAAGEHGCVPVSVLLRLRDLDLDPPEIDFHVFAAFNSVDDDFTGDQARSQVGPGWNFDGGLEIVVRRVGDGDIAG